MSDLGAMPDGPDLSAERQTFEWFTRPYEFLQWCADKFGDTFTLRFREFGPHVVFSNPAAHKEIFAADSQALSAGQANIILGNILGPGSMFSLDGEPHLEQRRIWAPSFTNSAIAGHGRTIREETLSAARAWPMNRPFPLLDSLLEISLNTITRLVFGTDEHGNVAVIKEQTKKLLSLVSSGAIIKETADAINDFDPRIRFRSIKQEIRRALQSEVAARRQQLNRTGDGILDALLAADSRDRSQASRIDITDEIVTLLVAGHETTATATAWALYWLHPTPMVLARLQSEIEFFDPQCNAHLTPGTSYLDAVCRESLRICPVVPIVARVVKRPLRICGVSLRPGVFISSAIYLTHHRGDLYQNPETFDPDRFLRRRYAPHEFLPFGGGVRRCIGMNLALFQMKVILASLLALYGFEIASRRSVQPVRRSLTVGPSEGLPVIASRRTAGEPRGVAGFPNQCEVNTHAT